MAPHSSTLAWKIPWTEEPGGLQSMGSLRVGQDWIYLAAAAALVLKLQYSGLLMWRPDSLEKTLMLGKAEGRRRASWTWVCLHHCCLFASFPFYNADEPSSFIHIPDFVNCLSVFFVHLSFKIIITIIIIIAIIIKIFFYWSVKALFLSYVTQCFFPQDSTCLFIVFMVCFKV